MVQVISPVAAVIVCASPQELLQAAILCPKIVFSNTDCLFCSNEYQEKVLPHDMPHLTGIQVSSPHTIYSISYTHACNDPQPAVLHAFHMQLHTMNQVCACLPGALQQCIVCHNCNAASYDISLSYESLSVFQCALMKQLGALHC